jgi:hypothetical protein
VTIPTWALPLLVTIFVLVLGFAWRLATRAETLTDNLKACIDRLTATSADVSSVLAASTRGDARRARHRQLPGPGDVI